ncbi:(2Fe-2S)-binding protein [Actinokineospora sp. UTMC 2448]|uniref:(2Fe-2S)-binding protein n=1 Tax=Actinokineospora sp. UTMC 2448 TaxID=2268449 RepID=UPI0021648D0C|nr:(2Fe-2S)-binding protein [Actinokineospora sp. UTMC 2448]UVS78642.1 Hydrogen cyanide synthase subunit HcnA [Actinokineospora sp. UTMC 2448]
MRVELDGEWVTAAPGQTVAGLLLARGRVSWRTTRAGGAPRGVFCGIGVCHDCLVVVNGVPDVRACQRLLADGDRVRCQDGAELPS